MWLYRVRTRNDGVLISAVTEYGLAGAIRFPTWQDFEEFLVDSNAYAEEERARMSKGVPNIFLDAYTEEERVKMSEEAADILLDALIEDRERGIRQVAKELKEEIEKIESLGNEKIAKIESLGNEKIAKELDHIKKLLNIV